VSLQWNECFHGVFVVYRIRVYSILHYGECIRFVLVSLVCVLSAVVVITVSVCRSATRRAVLRLLKVALRFSFLVRKGFFFRVKRH